MSNYVPPTTPIGMPPQQQFPQPPPQKKSNVLTYILVGCGTFVILGVIAVVAGGYFVWNKAKEAGLDPELMQKQPALAAAKMMVAMNPDIELVSVDEAKGLITVKDKKTGETVTINLADAQKGKVVFKKDGEDDVTVEGKANETAGSLEVKTKEGVAKFGSAAAEEGLPEWFPPYPGANVHGNYSSHGKDGYAGGFQFTTQDSVEQVIKFYEDNLRQAGFRMTTSLSKQDAKVTAGLASGEDTAARRTAFINVASTADGNQVSVVLTSK
ncbi:MAG TPA: hypothetical protein VNS63_00560 [Blastocatellia bacterium]|nr:hypothetical protein [Blastocatellia bacterium]